MSKSLFNKDLDNLLYSGQEWFSVGLCALPLSLHSPQAGNAFVEEWKECKLGDVCSRLSSGKNISASKISDSDVYPVFGGNGLRGYTDNSNFTGECAIIGRQGAFCGNVRFFSGEAYMTEHAVVVCGNEKANTRYLSYLLSTMNLGRLSGQSAQPGLAVGTLAKQLIKLPPLPTQQKIAAILSSLDDKIELNNKINTNLEQQAQAFFKNWFVDFEPFGGKMPEEWKVGKLSEIADYLNGLAMQKFRPLEDEEGLPVLKIKELRQGCCDDSSELCSPSKVKPEYIIHDGDVIFSWSGSLLVDIWCGGTCGLNQHLFKVTSKTYEKWFYYLWTKHHLDRFIFLAADKATTMGHIKREELDKAEVIILDDKIYSKLTMTLSPIIDTIINNRVENRRLSEIRDNLLPELMSGNINVEDITI